MKLAPVLLRKILILKPKLLFCRPFVVVLRRNEHGDPAFLMVLFTRNRYTENIIKEEKSWIAEVVAFTLFINDMKLHLEPDTECSRYKTQITGHRSLFYQYRKYPKHS